MRGLPDRRHDLPRLKRRQKTASGLPPEMKPTLRLPPDLLHIRKQRRILLPRQLSEGGFLLTRIRHSLRAGDRKADRGLW